MCMRDGHARVCLRELVCACGLCARARAFAHASARAAHAHIYLLSCTLKSVLAAGNRTNHHLKGVKWVVIFS